MTKEDKILEDLNLIKASLIELKVDMRWVRKSQDNHLAHHDKYMYIFLAGVVALIAKVWVG